MCTVWLKGGEECKRKGEIFSFLNTGTGSLLCIDCFIVKNFVHFLRVVILEPVPNLPISVACTMHRQIRQIPSRLTASKLSTPALFPV